MDFGMRFLVAIVAAVVGLFGYCTNRQENPVTGETQYVKLSPDQEVALGLEAAPQMAKQMGGLLADRAVQDYVDSVGRRVVQASGAAQTPYEFDFHVLADPETVNAFALPGGQIFITAALLARLQNEAQLAGVLGHEVGHVVARHASEHMAKQQLTQMLVGAAGIAAADPTSPGSGQRAAMIGSFVGNLVNLRYGRKDELESDRLGVRFMSEAGYDPRAMVGVMDVLEQASGGRGGVEWLQTHPNPGNRRAELQRLVERQFPNGVPDSLALGDRAAFSAVQARL